MSLMVFFSDIALIKALSNRLLYRNYLQRIIMAIQYVA